MIFSNILGIRLQILMNITNFNPKFFPHFGCVEEACYVTRIILFCILFIFLLLLCFPNRGLVRFAELMGCKDPSLDSNIPLTTLDVTFMNADLVESLVTIMESKSMTQSKRDDNDGDSIEKQRVPIEDTFLQKERTKSTKHKDVYVEASELTPAEQLAHEVRYYGCGKYTLWRF